MMIYLTALAAGAMFGAGLAPGCRLKWTGGAGV